MWWWPRNSRPDAAHRTVPVGADRRRRDGRWMSGPKTIEAFENRLLTTRTLVWNGPFGAFETAPFDAGTVAAAQGRGRGDQGGQAAFGGGRRRHGCGAGPCRRGGRFHLCLDRGRRVPGMAGRQRIAGRGGARRRSNEGEDDESRRTERRSRTRWWRRARACWPPTNPPAPSRSASTRSASQNTEENRRDYREMLFRTDEAMKEHISGVILYRRDHPPEGQGRHAAGQADRSGRRDSRHQGRCRRQAAGRLRPGETITEGLDGLRERFSRISQAGRALRQMARGDRHRPRTSRPITASTPMPRRWPAMPRWRRRTASCRSSSRKC